MVWVSVDSPMRPAWYLALAMWLITVLLNVALHFLTVGVPGLYYIVSLLAICCLGFGLSILLFRIAEATSRWRPLLRWSVLATSAFSLAATLAIVDALAARQIAEGMAENWRLSPSVQALANFGIMIWQFGLLAAAYSMLLSVRWANEQERNLAQARQEALEAERAATAARLAALRYQLNPHFLFNTLNAISSLVVTQRNALAEGMLASLCEFLRATLAGNPDDLVSVDEEFATLQTYLEVEAVRFPDTLRIEADCPDELREAKIPCFILQPLVENTIKYAVAPANRPVTIRIAVEDDRGDLLLRVVDDGDSDSAPGSGTGVGHTNIRQRLEALYGAGGKFEAVSSSSGFSASIRIAEQFWKPSIERFAA